MRHRAMQIHAPPKRVGVPERTRSASPLRCIWVNNISIFIDPIFAHGSTLTLAQRLSELVSGYLTLIFIGRGDYCGFTSIPLASGFPVEPYVHTIMIFPFASAVAVNCFTTAFSFFPAVWKMSNFDSTVVPLMVPLRSSSCQSPDLVLPRPFPSVLTTMAFDHSRRRWFGTCSCQPVPRGPPSSIKQLHTLGPPRPFALVAHDRRRSGRQLPRP